MKLSRLPVKKKNKNSAIIMGDTILFPHSVAPLFLTDKVSIKQIEGSLKDKREILVAFQKEEGKPSFKKKDLYPIGVLSHILQLIKLPDGNARVLIEGKVKTDINKVDLLEGKLTITHSPYLPQQEIGRSLALSMEMLKETFFKFAKGNKRIPKDVLSQVEAASTPDKLIGIVCPLLPSSPKEKYSILQENKTQTQIERALNLLNLESEKKELQQEISGRVRYKMEKQQKEYFLNEQIKEINKELGSDDVNEFEELKTKILELKMPEEAKNKALKELKRLKKLQPMAPESGVLRTYIEWLCDLPWSKKSYDQMNISHVAKLLDQDHYDLEKAKDRILDFIAVRQVQESLHAPILCFVGPPGTGKTSLGRSIARALNRSFVRISLGGVKDEAEIRGHRKTYVGALPGKIIQSMKKAGTANPVFLLDEIDKMGSDYKGDPSAALLEVLDPEQNSTFTDHYLELSYDLSEVMFITTANSLSSIPKPLLDRMEIVEIPGYTEKDKVKIAQNFIIPRQLKRNGLLKDSVIIPEAVLITLIRSYTMESGVRNLERSISRLIRKLIRKEIEKRRYQGLILLDSKQEEDFIGPQFPIKELKPDFSQSHMTVSKKDLFSLLGKAPLRDEKEKERSLPGIATGMAWTEVGGRILPVEVALLEGNGKMILTGKLGDVMKESAQIAISYIRSQSKEFRIDPLFYKKFDIHIHVPEGATPKDGPSAGITMTAALLSALKKTPLIPQLAMTGEITLSDQLLPIGGVKEKVLAAHRHGKTIILLPEKNRRDRDDLPQEIRDDLNFIISSSVKEAIFQIFPKGTFD